MYLILKIYLYKKQLIARTNIIFIERNNLIIVNRIAKIAKTK